MIRVVKDYFASSKFSVVAYVTLIVYFLCGLILIPVTLALRASEKEKFTCAVDTKSTFAYKTFVEKTCYSRYEQTYNSPLPLYGFVLLSYGLTVLVSVIYSLAVTRRMEEIDRSSNEIEEQIDDGKTATCGFYVFIFYFSHIVARSLFGILLTVLQHTVFYPNGFDLEFSCSLSTTELTSKIAKNSSAARFNVTSIPCENLTASEKELWGILLSVINTLIALILLAEIIYLCRRIPIFTCCSKVVWSHDDEFVTVYLLRKRYFRVHRQQQITDVTVSPLCETIEDSDNSDNNAEDRNSPNVELDVKKTAE